MGSQVEPVYLYAYNLLEDGLVEDDFEKCVRAFVTNCFDPTEIKAGFHHKTESKATTIWNGSNSKTTSRQTAGYEMLLSQLRTRTVRNLGAQTTGPTARRSPRKGRERT